MGARLYIGNLSWDTNEETLQNALSDGGRTVKDIHMVMDRETGRPRGFAFAEMATDAEAQEAIDTLNGVELDGRPLTVNEARERQPRRWRRRWRLRRRRRWKPRRRWRRWRRTLVKLRTHFTLSVA